jgi:hypothetical protein
MKQRGKDIPKQEYFAPRMILASDLDEHDTHSSCSECGSILGLTIRGDRVLCAQHTRDEDDDPAVACLCA